MLDKHDKRIFILTAARLNSGYSCFSVEDMIKTRKILEKHNKTFDDFEGLTGKETMRWFDER